MSRRMTEEGIVPPGLPVLLFAARSQWQELTKATPKVEVWLGDLYYEHTLKNEDLLGGFRAKSSVTKRAG